MRNWIIAAAALAAVVAPGVAAAQTGYVGAVYGNVDPDGADDEDFYGIEGAVAFAGSGSIVFEVDAAISEGDDTDAAYGLVGHVYARNDNHLVGGFVGVGQSEDGTGDDTTTWAAGLEGAKYFDKWTVAGAVYYANNDDSDVDGYGVNVEGRYFINDNFRVDAGVGYANADTPGGDNDITTFGVGTEYQFAQMPISIRAGYRTTDGDFGDADTITIGVRYNWGGTLRDRDRSGASQASVVGIAF